MLIHNEDCKIRGHGIDYTYIGKMEEYIAPHTHTHTYTPTHKIVK